MPRRVWIGPMLILVAGWGGCKSAPTAIHFSEVMYEEGRLQLKEAEDLTAREEYGDARLLLEDLTQRHPEYFRAWRALQDLTSKEEGLERAVEETKARLETRRVPINLTLAARLTKDGGKAVELLKEALSLDETYVWAHYGMAYLILKEKNVAEYEAARHHLEEALQYSYEFDEARRLYIENLRRLDDHDEERLQYEILIEFNELDMDARYNYADLLRSRFQDYEEALDQLEIILRREPDRIDAQLLRAMVLTQAGEYQSAESLYLYLASLHPNAVLNLALLYNDQLSRPQEALKFFQAYLAYSGPNADEKSFLDEKILVPTYIERLREEMD